MRFFNTSIPARANPRMFAVLFCLALAACGTKPKDLKPENGAPFPIAYPQAATQTPPAPPLQ